MSGNLVVADIGNTALKVLQFDSGGGILEHHSARFADDDFNLPPSLARGPAVAVSVNAAHLERVESLRGEPLTLCGRDVPIPLENATSHPEETGDDRLCAALAAWRRQGEALVVVGCGTAITVDAVDGSGRFLGGAIAPGVHAALGGLVAAAPLLPAVDPWQEPAEFPAGRTAEAMRTAARLGFAGLVDRLVYEARATLGDEAAPVFLGGGDGAWLQPHLRLEALVSVPHLVAEGVREAWRARDS